MPAHLIGFIVLANAFDRRVRLGQIFWFGVIGVVAVLMGYLLALSPLLVFIMLGGLGLLITLPYHSRIAAYLSVATFSSALILPYFPGRPYMWEFAGLLAWSGLLITVSLRQFAPNFGDQIRRHRWLFLGLFGYCLVLLVTMFYRGIGFRSLGTEMTGGRFYFQQLVCAVFPLLFVMLRLDEKTLTRLFIVQCLLASTYLVSDFIFSIAPRALFFLLQFFELPGDAINFEGQARVLGLRRWQSLYIVSTAVLYLMFVRFRLRDFFGFKGVILVPLALGIFGAGLLSGHRFIVFMITTVVFVIAITQRFINFKNGLVSVVALLLGLFIAYGYADQMPLAAQRALSILPGIDVRSEARSDALATLDTRKMLRELGWRMVPEYMWVGRGFGQPGTDYSLYWDSSSLSFHLNQGRFFNGFIGLLVNTGLFGTTFMLTFLLVGSKLAFEIIARIRRNQYEDTFSRVATVLASLWVANVTSFLFLHGDSEYAAKTFSLQAGLLLTCNRLLAKREEEVAPVSEPIQTFFPINRREAPPALTAG